MAKDKPPPYFPAIHADFSAHEAFLDEPKTVSADQIVLHDRGKSGHEGSVEVVTMLLVNGCTWVAVQSLKLNISYRFSLRTPDYGPEPCFRFDSCGLAHRNDIGTLSEQVIPTPHFHNVAEDGIMRAYQTPELADPVQGAAIAKDPQLGANHFCQELNLVAPSGGSVAYRIFASEMALVNPKPLGDATFPTT